MIGANRLSPKTYAINRNLKLGRDSRSEPFGAIEEQHRRLVVRLVFLIYALLLFEGILRKWIMPQWSKPLFFIRDPFVLLIYILVLSRRTRLRAGFLEIGCLFSLAALILTVAHHMSGDFDFSTAVLAASGWRNYFFYIPLAFIIGRYFDLRDLNRLLLATSLISVAVAMLVIVQFASSPVAPINAGSGDTADEIYRNPGLPGGGVRPFGTFTSNLGLSVFTVSAVAIAISMWLAPHGSMSKRFYLVLACAILGPSVCLCLSGSRGAFVWTGLVVLMALAGLSCASPGMGLKAGAFTSALIFLTLVAGPVVFPQATESLSRRWSDAGDYETNKYGSGGVFARALYEVFNFRFLFELTPPEGYGLGTAGNAAWRLGTRAQTIIFTNEKQVGAAESDWGRNILELGPIFGCLFILFRIAFGIWLAKIALAATARSGHPLPWLLFAFVSHLILNGQITANGTVNGYGWLFAGLCLAASNGVCPLGRHRRFSIALRG
jgi:hypothetical protein